MALEESLASNKSVEDNWKVAELRLYKKNAQILSKHKQKRRT
jgi:hypothetical protein